MRETHNLHNQVRQTQDKDLAIQHKHNIKRALPQARQARHLRSNTRRTPTIPTKTYTAVNRQRSPTFPNRNQQTTKPTQHIIRSAKPPQVKFQRLTQPIVANLREESDGNGIRRPLSQQARLKQAHTTPQKHLQPNRQTSRRSHQLHIHQQHRHNNHINTHHI